MLAGKSYVPLLKTKIAELEAYRNLSSQTKELIFPIFLLRPWPNANHLSLAITKIKDAVAGHSFGLGLDDERYRATSGKPAQSEFDALFSGDAGYRNFYEFLRDIDDAVPVLRPTRDANELLLQLGNAENLDRGLVVYQNRQSLIPISDSIAAAPPLIHDTIFVVDAGWSRDLPQMQAWAHPIVQRIVDAVPDAEIVVMSSSFPDSFAHIVGNSEEVAHEHGVFSAVRQQVQSADLTFGDWASTRMSQNGGGGSIPSRIDIPRSNSWQIFREDPNNDLGFLNVANAVQSHECFISTPHCWGRMQVAATDGNGSGITGTKANTSARINMHMTIQSGATNTIDTDERPYED